MVHLPACSDDRRPLTIAAYEAHCRLVAAGQCSADIRVQVARKGAVLCGRVARTDRFGDADWFRVETGIGSGWMPGRSVRLCSGVDGRCSCVAPDAALRSERQSGAWLSGSDVAGEI